MNREVKFRGKRIDNGEWVYGYYSYNSVRNTHMITEDNSGTHVVIPETVGQFTGLKDKNGVEIFEGDILNTTEYKELEVIFQDGMFGVMMCLPSTTEDGTEYFDEFWSLYTLKENDYFGKEQPFFGIEIIGNIHEHPELLEGK